MSCLAEAAEHDYVSTLPPICCTLPGGQRFPDLAATHAVSPPKLAKASLRIYVNSCSAKLEEEVPELFLSDRNLARSRLWKTVYIPWCRPSQRDQVIKRPAPAVEPGLHSTFPKQSSGSFPKPGGRCPGVGTLSREDRSAGHWS